jgi:uncharacterized protein YqgC (DUF456 family)
MDVLLYAVAGGLIAAGLFGSVIPALPGIPLAFAGLWLAAGADHYRHIGLWWLLCIAAVGAVGLTLDLVAGARAPSAPAPVRVRCGAPCSAV